MDVEIFKNKIALKIRASMEEVFVQNTLSAAPSAQGASVSELCRRHGEYLLLHLRVFSNGQRLAGRLAEVTPPPPSGLQRASYDFEFETTVEPANVRIEEDVLNEFSYAPGNRWEATYVVRVAQETRTLNEALLLTSGEPLIVRCDWTTVSNANPATATVDRWRLIGDYVRHGILHILKGYDHLLFISALVLAVVTLWDLVKVITAFTLAHSITLTLCVLNIVRLPEKVVEPMIAASIVFVALQNVFWPARSRGAARLGVAFFFGLFHGLGFAGGLLDAMAGMAGLTVGLAIFAFSLGVEIGHQIVVIPLFIALKVLRSQGGPAARAGERLFRYGSAAISCAGLFYLVEALRW